MASISAQDFTDLTLLLSHYAWALDKGDLTALGNLFTPDGIIQDTAGNRYNGRDGVVGYVRQLTNTPEFKGRQHIIYNLVIDEAGPDRYLGRAYWTVIKWDGKTNEKKVDGTGHSVDHFVKIDGRWFLKERVVNRWSSTNGPWTGK
jgi:hypothetical protein